MGERLGVILSPVDGIGYRNAFAFPNHPGVLPGIKFLRHGQPNNRSWPVSAADAGTFTSTAATTPGTATDTKKAWVVNSLIGGLIVTSDGKFLQIASNTATVATGTAAWTGGVPAATATYYIVPALQPAPAAGMTLTRAAGTSTLKKGTYMVHYTYAYDTGATSPPIYETGPSPPVQVTLTTDGDQINVAGLPALPANVTALRFYMVRAPLGPPTVNRGFIQQVTTNANFSIVTQGDGAASNNYNGTECTYPNESTGSIQVPALQQAWKSGSVAAGIVTAGTALDITVTDPAVRNLGSIQLSLVNGTVVPAGNIVTIATLKSIADNASFIASLRSSVTTLATNWVLQWVLNNLGTDGTWVQFTIPNTMITANSRIYGSLRYGKAAPVQAATMEWNIVSLNPGVDFHVGFYNIGKVPITDQNFVWDYEIVN